MGQGLQMASDAVRAEAELDANGKEARKALRAEGRDYGRRAHQVLHDVCGIYIR